jgi:hypothetical protein
LREARRGSGARNELAAESCELVASPLIDN